MEDQAVLCLLIPLRKQK